MSSLKKTIISLLFLFITFLTFAFALKDDFIDSDVFYHYALSKILSDNNILFIKKLDALSLLGWDKIFVDKEFGFHLLTSFFYKCFGEYGFTYLTLGSALLTLTISFLALLKIVKSHQKAIVLTLFLITPYLYLHRLTMPRPQIVSIFLYVLLLSGILLKSKKKIYGASFLHPLCYHTFYFFPYHLLSLMFFRLKIAKKTILLALFFFVLALMINPYFPDLFYLSWIQTKVAFLTTGLPKSFLPTEIVPPSLGGSWNLHLYFFTIVFFQLLHRRWSREILYLLHLFLLFYAVLFFNFRVLEYLMPVSIFLLAYTWKALDLRKEAFPLVISLILLHVANVAFFIKQRPFEFHRLLVTYLKESVNRPLDVLPKEKAFTLCNCSWTTGSNTLYMRPMAKFVDLLDPAFLYHKNPSLHYEREKLVMGKQENPMIFIKELCKAQYFSCQTGPILFQLELDLRFKRLTPSSFPLNFNFTPDTKIPIENSKDLAIYQVEDIPFHSFFKGDRPYPNSLSPQKEITVIGGNWPCRLEGKKIKGLSITHNTPYREVWSDVKKIEILPPPNKEAHLYITYFDKKEIADICQSKLQDPRLFDDTILESLYQLFPEYPLNLCTLPWIKNKHLPESTF